LIRALVTNNLFQLRFLNGCQQSIFARVTASLAQFNTRFTTVFIAAYPSANSAVMNTQNIGNIASRFTFFEPSYRLISIVLLRFRAQLSGIGIFYAK
jgi:hypothetical protein